MRNLLRLSISLLLLVVCPFLAMAQFETASVLGYVRDSSGAFVPNATVTLTNQGTKSKVTVKTNDQGAYQFTDVKVGQYSVSSEANGFTLSKTENFSVQVAAHQRVDLTMQIGSQSDTVTVSAAAAILETDASDRGQVIGAREVQNIPLNGREYADLAALVPGVRRNILESTTSDSSRDASFNVNGMRSEFNNFLLDGVDNNSYGTSNQDFSNQAIQPSPDAIDEFKVQTDNYSAEYGRSAGAVINVSIKSGTNQFHGNVYEYIRNTSLNAIGPFLPPTNTVTGKAQKPTLNRNQFGATFGGPIIKDKLFFFADYEGMRQVTHQINTATVPDTDQNGTSAIAVAKGGYVFYAVPTAAIPNPAAIKLTNPYNGTVYQGTSNTTDPTFIPFTDPSISSFAKGVITALPNPNLAGIVSNNYVSLPSDTIKDDKGDVRVDYTANPKTTAFVRYSHHLSNIFSPPAIQGSAGGNSNGYVLIFNQQIAGGVTHSFNANHLIDARFAFTRTDGGKTPYGHSLPSLEGGIVGLPTTGPEVTSLNAQNVNNFSQFGSLTSNPQFQNPYVYNPKINYTWTKGRSTYKFGYEYQAIFTTIDDFNPSYGADTYAGYYSSTNGATTTAAADNGTKEAVALADFLFGARNTYQLNNFTVANLNQRMHFFYVQDDVRLTPKLTVNAGLRYELVTPQWESANHLANYDPSTQTMITASNGSIYNRALVNMPKLDFAPRVGAAYQIDNKTVIRAGYGIGYAQFNREGGENLLVYNIPYVVNTSITQTPSLGLCTTAQAAVAYNPANPNPCFRASYQGYPTNFANPANVTAASTLNTQVRYLPKNLPTGYVQSYHLTVQRQLGSHDTLEVAYVGEHGVKLETLADLNQASPNPVTATCNATVTTGCLSLAARRPIQTFNTIEETLPAGYLLYSALQTKFEHRTSHGLYLLNSFTWSRAIDNAGGHLDTNDGDNSRINLANPRGERGPSGYNQPLNETLSIVYDLPYGKGRTFGGDSPIWMQEILGGWQVNAINNINSGLPFNVIYSPTAAQQVSTILNQRPNQTGVGVLPKSQRVKTNTTELILNSASFSLPTANQPYGNAGRNSLRLDPYYDLDFALHKQFDLVRNVKFDFRAEAFNLLNKVNYEGPSSETVGSSSFGLASGVTSAFPARVLQFAGKIVF
ncbi:TonB-dependent receptor [Granulicella paludicola]|uniref:TonB-dependent receptor n=1 Tax=Granulicella paludicola TaxID=474951 RepID=UPI0021DF83DD|nr:TonB-dependent receptor [Granulicella paludicola]